MNRIEFLPIKSWDGIFVTGQKEQVSRCSFIRSGATWLGGSDVYLYASRTGWPLNHNYENSNYKVSWTAAAGKNGLRKVFPDSFRVMRSYRLYRTNFQDLSCLWRRILYGSWKEHAGSLDAKKHAYSMTLISTLHCKHLEQIWLYRVLNHVWESQFYQCAGEGFFLICQQKKLRHQIFVVQMYVSENLKASKLQ